MSFQSTNELRNIDISQILRNPDMKPKKNPMHYRYIDRSEDVFSKFEVEPEYNDKGAHNYIFKNDNFVVRISRKIFCITSNYTFNEYIESINEDYICFDSKKKDEQILIKAIKSGISPRVYYFGNISIHNNVHRFCVFEAYHMSLCKFIRRNKVISLFDPLDENIYYSYIHEVYDDIVYQLEDLVDNVVMQNIVYYDIKPENIVINCDKTKKLELKLIDWDSDFCIEEEFMNNEEYKVCAKFLMMLIITAYMNVYLKNNIFNKRLRELYHEDLLPNIYYLLFDSGSEFMTILLQYFYNSFNMTFQNKDEFDETDEGMKERAKKNFVRLVEKCII